MHPCISRRTASNLFKPRDALLIVEVREAGCGKLFEGADIGVARESPARESPDIGSIPIRTCTALMTA
jgi:hypothetical protein